MVGRLLDALDNGPLADNTVIVLWGDHGYHLGHKEHWEKFALWNQASRVPLIFVSPEHKSSVGEMCFRPASLLDVYPTLLDLCGLERPSHLDGKSLENLIHSPKAPSHDPVLITHGPGNHAVQSERWRYIRYADGSEELYDHANDLNEFTNVAGKEEHARLKKSLAGHLPKSETDPQPEPPNKKNPK